MTESMLATLDFTPDDHIIAIRENNNADSSFILASIIASSFKEEDNICLVTLHNTVSHYQNIGRRYGFDLLNQVSQNHARIVEPIVDIVEDFGKEPETRKYLTSDSNLIANKLFTEICEKVNELLNNNNRKTYIIIDDISHLSDIVLDLKVISNFINNLIGLTKNDKIFLVINCHVSTDIDEIIINMLFHVADICISVSPLKTGRSKNITGVLTIVRKNENTLVSKPSLYHYKLLEKEIKIITPGRAII